MSAVYLVAMVGLLGLVAAISHGTGAWWSALIAAPAGATIAVVYADAWLSDYHRHNA